ncbi:MAG: quinolinate synthase NadA, partial [Candidatus Thiodiazotropha sp. 6PLUC3]
MNVESLKLPDIKVPEHPQWPTLTEPEKQQLKAQIKEKLSQQNAVLVAHYYTDADLQ